MKDFDTDTQSNQCFKRINLHIHTKFSDGAFKPKKIIERSIENNLDIISITDHDTVDAYKHIPSCHSPMKILPGIELSSSWVNDDVHVLGYGIDIHHKPLLEILTWMKEGRRNRAKKMLGKLSVLGINIPLEHVLSYTGDMNLIVRPHIAQALVANNHCRNKQEAFEKFIGNDAPAYVPKPILSTSDAISIIHDAGGIAVIAHPSKIKSLDYLDDFLNMGLDGVEVWHPDHSETLINELAEYSIKNGLYQTGGTDFHGEEDFKDYIGNTFVSEAALDDIQTIWNNYKCSQT